MRNSTGNADKENLRKQPKTLEYIEKKKERKMQHEKNNSTIWRNKPESTGERRKIKKI